MKMIISLSGRKGCGKSTLLTQALKLGFHKISIADFLKETVAKLFNWNLEDLLTQEGKEETLSNKVVFNENKALELAKLCGITENLYDKDVILNTRREALQHIGTEVLRKHDQDFHIKKTIETMEKSNIDKWICDDCRFQNEKKYFDSVGAICIFIIRPGNFDYSNHQSEIDLRYKDFNIIIYNRFSLSILKNRFIKFVNCFISKKEKWLQLREDWLYLHKKHSIKYIAKYKKCSIDKVRWWAIRLLIPLDKYKYDCKEDVFYEANILSSYFAGLLSADGCVKGANYRTRNILLELCSNDLSLIKKFRKFLKTKKQSYVRIRNNVKNYIMTINRAEIIEDLKMWCLEPRKSKKNKIPYIIKNNAKMLKCWLIGLIDGDGSIFKYGKQKEYICISFLASTEVVDFVNNWLEIKSSINRNHKGIGGLDSIKYHGRYAIEFYNKVYEEDIGLSRKWSKIKKLIKERNKIGLKS